MRAVVIAVDAPPHLFLGIRRRGKRDAIKKNICNAKHLPSRCRWVLVFRAGARLLCAGCRLPNLVVFLVTFPSHALIIFLLSSVSLFFCLIIFLPLSLCLAPRAPIHLQKNKGKAKGTRCLGFSKVIHAATRRQTRQMAAATTKGGGGVPRPIKWKLSYCMMHTATVTTNNQDAHTPIGELTARVYCMSAWML